MDLDFQFFQNRQTAVHVFVMASATVLIQVDPAVGAKPSAIFTAQDLHGDLQQDLLDDQRIKIDQIVLVTGNIQVIRAEFLFFRMLRLRRRQNILEGATDGQVGSFEAAGTVRFRLRSDVPFKVKGFLDSFQGNGTINAAQGKPQFFFFRKDLPGPVFIFGKLNFQALFRDVRHTDLQVKPATSALGSLPFLINKSYKGVK
jgi:hypothetical protein